MRSTRPVVLILALLAPSLARAAAPDGHRWDDYANPRFNYAICYPRDLLSLVDKE